MSYRKIFRNNNQYLSFLIFKNSSRQQYEGRGSQKNHFSITNFGPISPDERHKTGNSHTHRGETAGLHFRSSLAPSALPPSRPASLFLSLSFRFAFTERRRWLIVPSAAGRPGTNKSNKAPPSWENATTAAACFSAKLNCSSLYRFRRPVRFHPPRA